MAARLPGTDAIRLKTFVVGSCMVSRLSLFGVVVALFLACESNDDGGVSVGDDGGVSAAGGADSFITPAAGSPNTSTSAGDRGDGGTLGASEAGHGGDAGDAVVAGLGGDASPSTAGTGGASMPETPERNLLFKSVVQADAYEAKFSGIPLADAQGRFTELGGQGYVVTTSESFSLLGDTSIRYLAFKPVGSTVTYEAKFSGVPLGDAQARFAELGGQGYVVTTSESFSLSGDTSIRYLAFKPVGSTVTYEAKFNGVPLGDAQARFAELGGQGYVVTTSESFSILGDTSIRYLGFKPVLP